MVAHPAAAPGALAVRGRRVALADGRVLIDGLDLTVGAGPSAFARVLFEPDELAAAGFDVVAAALHGVLTAGFARLVSDIFVDRTTAPGSPPTGMLRRASPEPHGDGPQRDASPRPRRERRRAAVTRWRAAPCSARGMGSTPMEASGASPPTTAHIV